MNEVLNDAIAKRLQSAKHILVASHIRPDGDAIGSLLGLGMALEEAGKKVQMVLADGVPVSFRHLEGSQRIVRKPTGELDTIVVVDCSDLERVGSGLNGFTRPHINIDHHVTNVNFADINVVNPSSVSTTSLLVDCLPAWGLHISQPVASALLTGLVSDTLGFRTSNMTPDALRQAASLMEKGADLPELYMRALITRTYNAARYWGAGLSRLQKENGLVWTSLTLADREAIHYNGNDDADLVNVLSAIDEAEVAVIFVEQKGGHVKVSWRSHPAIDVSQIAFNFGGGGHPAASGADIAGTLDEVQRRVIKETLSLLTQRAVKQDSQAQ